jgi:hypothetical protein
MKTKLENLTGLCWGVYHPRELTFGVIFAPKRSGYVDLEVGLLGRSFYVTRIPR